MNVYQLYNGWNGWSCKTIDDGHGVKAMNVIAASIKQAFWCAYNNYGWDGKKGIIEQSNGNRDDAKAFCNYKGEFYDYWRYHTGGSKPVTKKLMNKLT